MIVTYIARRSLIAGHIVSDEYVLTIDTQAISRARKVERVTQRALGGATETLYFRADKTWRVVFAPVRGATRDALQEFLDSTESGDTFSMSLFGDVLPDVAVIREDDGYAWQEVAAGYGWQTDWLQTEITVREI